MHHHAVKQVEHADLLAFLDADKGTARPIQRVDRIIGGCDNCVFQVSAVFNGYDGGCNFGQGSGRCAFLCVFIKNDSASIQAYQHGNLRIQINFIVIGCSRRKNGARNNCQNTTEKNYCLFHGQSPRKCCMIGYSGEQDARQGTVLPISSGGIQPACVHNML